jgi:3',5'-cyclic AMP phosphodiesterase CpdA
MAIVDVPLRIAHVSDIHCGEPTFQPEVMASTVEAINRLKPDVVVVAGDLTAAGYEWEFETAAEWLGRIEAPTVIVPGNHDSRHSNPNAPNGCIRRGSPSSVSTRPSPTSTKDTSAGNAIRGSESS